MWLVRGKRTPHMGMGKLYNVLASKQFTCLLLAVAIACAAGQASACTCVGGPMTTGQWTRFLGTVVLSRAIRLPATGSRWVVPRPESEPYRYDRVALVKVDLVWGQPVPTWVVLSTGFGRGDCGLPQPEGKVLYYQFDEPGYLGLDWRATIGPSGWRWRLHLCETPGGSDPLVHSSTSAKLGDGRPPRDETPELQLQHAVDVVTERNGPGQPPIRGRDVVLPAYRELAGPLVLDGATSSWSNAVLLLRMALVTLGYALAKCDCDEIERWGTPHCYRPPYCAVVREHRATLCETADDTRYAPGFGREVLDGMCHWDELAKAVYRRAAAAYTYVFIRYVAESAGLRDERRGD